MTYHLIMACILSTIGFLSYWLLPHRVRIQNGALLLLSVAFYGLLDMRFLGLMLASAVFAYSTAVLMDKGYKLAFVTGVLGCLSTLGFFKYFNFFAESIALGLKSIGLSAPSAFWQVAVPLGVSFYSFQLVGYLCDVRRGVVRVERNLADFILFTCFFPQIVAGPIGRAVELLPQYKVARHFDESFAVEACRQILWGAFAKFVVADNCAMIGSTLLGCQSLSATMTTVGAAAITIQIYADFSGYSNMAVGVGKLFGIRLRQNFAYPYFATTFGEFWHRWHISLTTWFRDYVYFPLGGSRCSMAKTIRNVWIVFLLSGLWHGAAWTFVAWGAMHALFMTFGIIRKRMKVTECFEAPLVLILSGLVWLLFFAPSFAEAGRWFISFTHFRSMATWPRIPLNVCIVAALGTLVLFSTEFFHRDCEFGLEWRGRKNSALSSIFRWTVYVILTMCIICCHGVGESFIYQKF